MNSTPLIRLHHVAHRRRRGFTLIEILVVSIVISILSTIAIINIQQFVDNNKRKAVIADLRSLTTAVSFAVDDIGYYPKLCFLQFDKHAPNLSFVDTASPLADSIGGFHESFQAYGLNYIGGGATLATVDNWKGPYLGAGQIRGGVAQGEGGRVNVQIKPDNLFPNQRGQVQPWPADVWGNPYVQYLMTWELVGSNYERRFLGVPLSGGVDQTEFRESPRAFNAIASYGKNRVPGLGEYPDVAAENARKAARLYDEVVDVSLTPLPRFRMLEFTQITDAHRQVLSNTPNAIPAAIGAGPGMLDSGSDDLVFEF